MSALPRRETNLRWNEALVAGESSEALDALSGVDWPPCDARGGKGDKLVLETGLIEGLDAS